MSKKKMNGREGKKNILVDIQETITSAEMPGFTQNVISLLNKTYCTQKASPWI